MQWHRNPYAQILTVMPVKLPTTPPDATPDKPADAKFHPFRPEMPQIPGVHPGSPQAQSGLRGIDNRQLLQIGSVAAGVLLIVALVSWRLMSKPRSVGKSASSETSSAEEIASTPALPSVIAPVHNGPTVAATVEELSKPWAAKKFIFVKPVTQENIKAIVIRLPNGELWAFSLQGPFGRCELEFVTDLATLASKYGYTASHPMVVSPCDSTVYDPLKIGALGGNTWVRGEIVQGNGLRPPISIEVKVRGQSIVADSIE
jgi:hypothetical protein